MFHKIPCTCLLHHKQQKTRLHSTQWELYLKVQIHLDWTSLVGCTVITQCVLYAQEVSQYLPAGSSLLLSWIFCSGSCPLLWCWNLFFVFYNIFGFRDPSRQSCFYLRALVESSSSDYSVSDWFIKANEENPHYYFYTIIHMKRNNPKFEKINWSNILYVVPIMLTISRPLIFIMRPTGVSRPPGLEPLLSIICCKKRVFI